MTAGLCQAKLHLSGELEDTLGCISIPRPVSGDKYTKSIMTKQGDKKVQAVKTGQCPKQQNNPLPT